MNVLEKWVRNTFICCRPFYVIAPGQRWRSYSMQVNHRIGINHAHRFVFVRVPKNASTVISLSLFRNITGEQGSNASLAKKRIFNTPTSLSFGQVKEVMDTYYKFAFVRDPFSRILSAYLQKIQRGGSERKAKYKRFIRKRLNLNPGHEISFDVFIRYLDSGGLMDDPHWTPQYCYIDLFGPSQLDFTGKVENLTPDLQAVYTRIFGENSFTLPDFSKKVTGAKNSLDDYYTPESQKIIRRLYKRDLVLFDSAK